MEDSSIEIRGTQFSSELNDLNKEEKENKNSILKIVVIVLILLAILLIIIFLILEFSESTKLAEINCVFDVPSNTEPIEILGNNYVKNSVFDILIDGKMITYSKSYLFQTTGKHIVSFIIYEDLNMNYMFKDINFLLSVNMTSDKDAKITSMISSFENCSLETLVIKGFDISLVKSMHKFLYRSNGKQINLTQIEIDTRKIEDMSYMFADSGIKYLDLKNMSTAKVYNMSHMFSGCTSLLSLDLSEFNTNKVKDMTYLFNKCEYIFHLNISNFKTDSVIKIRYI